MRKFFLLLFLAAGSSFARADSCALSSPTDVVSCVLKNHPDIVRMQAQVSKLGAFAAAARQRPNPDFEASALHFTDSGSPSLEAEASYLHIFETGGKRKERLGRAEAQKELVLAQLDKTKEEVKLQTILKLYRLRQIQQEIHIVDETLGTFGTIIRQHRARPRLAPEQEVSLNVFILAEGDQRLRKSRLQQELAGFRQFFTVAADIELESVYNALPKRKTDWEKLVIPASFSNLGGAARRAAELETALSQAEMNLAVSEAMPNVAAGPRIQSESGNGQSNHAFGAMLSLALPFNRNKGSRSMAEYELMRSQAILAQRKKEFEAAYKAWNAIYDEAVNALKNSPSAEQLEKKHHDLESEFERGLISAPLVIEAHRQLSDFITNQNDQEIRAVEALWSLYTLQGRILEEKL